MPAPAYGIAPARYRLPDATHLGRVVLQVSDLARSVAWYEQVLGMRVLVREGERAELGAHGDDRVILELRSRPGVMPPSRPRLGLYHFAILLPTRADLGAFVQHLANVHARVGTADHLVSEAVYLQDPDNLGIEVYADRPRDAWRTSGRELQMTTDPLDLASLVADAVGRDWRGMPAGTVLGHVHLHVGSLAEGEAFYHDALGFDKVVWSYPGALFLSAGGYHHHLGTNVWARGAHAASDGEARLVEWEVVLPSPADVDAVADSLEASGRTVERVGPSIRVPDPWGTTVRVRSG